MATGIPKTKWNSLKPPLSEPNGTSGGKTDVCVAYGGKKSERAILETKPAQFRLLWPQKHGVKSLSRLYYGENLGVLASLAADSQVCGKVRLVYIDPPYATKSVFQSRKQADAYADLLEGAHYLEFLRERLILLRELLADDGSIYVHLDDNMAFLAKPVMDEIFGRSNFRNWITRKKCNPKNYTKKAYGNVADFILFYTKTDNYVWHRPVEPWTELRANKEYVYVEPGTGRRFKKVPLHAPGVRNGETGKPWRGTNPPPGKHWQYPPRVLDEMDARGEIFWSANGNPRRKIYLDESAGVPLQDIWLDLRDAHNQNIKISGYPTEKNPELISRVIEASSSKGDLVLDCFAGSGTTMNVASHLGRHWIGVDNSIEAISTTLRRFAKGLEPMGDFVNKEQSCDAGDLADETLPLFGFTVPPKPRPKEDAQHSPITDFRLFAQEPYHGELGSVLGYWESWVAASPKLGETPTPYRVTRNPRNQVAKGTSFAKTPPLSNQ
ncbi:MAG: restriction endonuclease subunit M [Verrucomicrobia bacterium]|nr:MAG: restriction endonuclease subunit M [Verrucomicrobiota bacterium]